MRVRPPIVAAVFLGASGREGLERVVDGQKLVHSNQRHRRSFAAVCANADPTARTIASARTSFNR